jgi:hypothetical protein
VSKAPSRARRSEVKPAPQRAKSSQRTADQKTAEKTVEDSTIKATFYLTQDTVNGLEDAWLQLRRTSDAGQRGSITKSLIVRLALEMALEDIAAKGSASQLAKRLDQHNS